MKTKTGIDLINDERIKQIFTHHQTPQLDLQNNNKYQLKDAAHALLLDNAAARERCRPADWDLKPWQKLINKPYAERITIAGAFLAAELDRLSLKQINAVTFDNLDALNKTYIDLCDQVNKKYKNDPGAVEVLKGFARLKDHAAEIISESY